MKKNNLFLDLHVIQTLPPSNVNRDDTGSPKTAQYGGVRRARVSSQSWKKAIRDYFKKNFGASNFGVRTVNIVDYVAGEIVKIDPSISHEKAMIKAENTLNNTGISTSKQKTKALFFLGNTQAKNLAQAAIDGADKKKMKKKEKDELKSALQDILNDNLDIDIALFGRMLAGKSNLNEDASSQIAHAISTHAIDQEFDFYTAVDDLTESTGAGMLGTIEFNSSTLYRYANVGIHQLSDQLKDVQATKNTIELFIEAFVKSLPTGKINTFANQTLPQLVFLTLRKDRPVNLVSAFEKPVKSREGYVDKSIEKLFEEYKNVEKFVDKPIFAAYVSTEDFDLKNDSILEKENLVELIETFLDVLDSKLENYGE